MTITKRRISHSHKNMQSIVALCPRAPSLAALAMVPHAYGQERSRAPKIRASMVAGRSHHAGVYAAPRGGRVAPGCERFKAMVPRCHMVSSSPHVVFVFVLLMSRVCTIRFLSPPCFYPLKLSDFGGWSRVDIALTPFLQKISKCLFSQGGSFTRGQLRDHK